MEERNGSALASPRTGSVEGPRDYRRCLASVWSRRRPCAHRSSSDVARNHFPRACPPAGAVWHTFEGFAKDRVVSQVYRRYTRHSRYSLSHARYMNSQDQPAPHGVRVERGKDYARSVSPCLLLFARDYPYAVSVRVETRSRSRIPSNEFVAHGILDFKIRLEETSKGRTMEGTTFWFLILCFDGSLE